MRIENADGFRLAFNCIVRLYRKNYDDKLLALLHRICDEYLVWFHLQTVFCSVRDLLHDGNCTDNLYVPERQKTSFELLLKRLVKQCIMLECSRCEGGNGKEEILQEFGQQVGLIPGVYENVRFQSFEEFMEWIRENQLDIQAVKRIENSRKTLPIRKEFVRDFGKICLLMIQYSFGRKTYTRYACYTFIYHNIRLLDERMIIEIRDYIENVKDDESRNYWLNLTTVLEKELQRRKFLNLYAEIYKDAEVLDLILSGCVSKEMLVSYKVCREAWWIISVFEEFIKRQNESEYRARYWEFVRCAKEMIGRKLSKYEEISE